MKILFCGQQRKQIEELRGDYMKSGVGVRVAYCSNWLPMKYKKNYKKLLGFEFRFGLIFRSVPLLPLENYLFIFLSPFLFLLFILKSKLSSNKSDEEKRKKEEEESKSSNLFLKNDGSHLLNFFINFSHNFFKTFHFYYFFFIIDHFYLIYWVT